MLTEISHRRLLKKSIVVYMLIDIRQRDYDAMAFVTENLLWSVSPEVFFFGTMLFGRNFDHLSRWIASLFFWLPRILLGFGCEENFFGNQMRGKIPNFEILAGLQTGCRARASQVLKPGHLQSKFIIFPNLLSRKTCFRQTIYSTFSKFCILFANSEILKIMQKRL